MQKILTIILTFIVLALAGFITAQENAEFLTVVSASHSGNVNTAVPGSEEEKDCAQHLAELLNEGMAIVETTMPGSPINAVADAQAVGAEYSAVFHLSNNSSRNPKAAIIVCQKAEEGATFNHTGITTGCSQCHLPEYNATTNPNHIAAGFPTSCETCHNTNTWQGAVFNHTFMINSGPHKNFQCAECHQVPSNYNVFSCIHCHEHTQSMADATHQGILGYSWNSAACVSCHPTGSK